MIRILFLIFCLISTFQLAAQEQTIFISGTIDSIDFKSINISKYGIRKHLKVNPNNLIPIQPDGTFSSVIPIEGKGFYKLGDLFAGHEIFLRPGDSIFISLKKRVPKVEEYSTAFSLATTSRFPKNITFFDEINVLYPIIYYDTSYSSPAVFKKALTNDYFRKVNLIHQYERQKFVSKDFVSFAEAELQSIYIRAAASLKNKLSRSAFDKDYSLFPFVINLSDSLFAVSTQYFGSAAYINSIYFLNDYDEQTYYSNLKGEYQAVNSFYKGFVKDFLLSEYLEDFAGKNDPYFETAYDQFLRECKNEVIRNVTVKNIKQKLAQKSDSRLSEKKKTISFSEMLEKSFVEDVSGKRIPLKNIFSDNKMTIIDSWATWCYPCLRQFPFMKKIEDQYAAKVNFVYLSFDKSREKWKEYLGNNKKTNTNQFRLIDEFDSPFTEYLNIENIPRYVLISENGDKLLNGNMPIPSMYEDFNKILINFIK